MKQSMALVVCVVGFSACTQSDLGAAQNMAPLDQLTRAACERTVACGGGDKGDVDYCVSHRMMFYGDYMVEAMADGRLGLRDDALAKCIEEYNGLSCNNPLATMFSCLGRFHGLVPLGGRCAMNLECSEGYCDNVDADGEIACGGSCRAADANYDCSITNVCPRGSACDPATSRCAPRKAQGATCIGSDCAEGLECKSDASGARQCQLEGRKLGEPCTALIFNDCAAGLWCDRSQPNGACSARIASGASCTDHASCPDAMGCFSVSADAGTTCQRWRKEGESCGSQNICASLLYCDPTTEKCAGIDSAVGLSCESDFDCWSGITYCSAATKQCQRSPRLGEPCELPVASDDDDHCGVGTCDPLTKVCTMLCSQE